MVKPNNNNNNNNNNKGHSNLAIGGIAANWEFDSQISPSREETTALV